MTAGDTRWRKCIAATLQRWMKFGREQQHGVHKRLMGTRRAALARARTTRLDVVVA
jgi:hypothetical protein